MIDINIIMKIDLPHFLLIFTSDESKINFVKFIYFSHLQK